MMTMYKPKDILILKHIYDKNVLIYDVPFLNAIFVNLIDVEIDKKYLKPDGSYYVWDWMDNV